MADEFKPTGAPTGATPGVSPRPSLGGSAGTAGVQRPGVGAAGVGAAGGLGAGAAGAAAGLGGGGAGAGGLGGAGAGGFRPSPAGSQSRGQAQAQAQAQAQPQANVKDAPVAGNVDLVMSIPVEVQIVLGSTTMPVATLMNLGRGAVITLDKQIGDPVDIVVNGRVIARGEVIVLEDDSSRFGVSLIEVIGK